MPTLHKITEVADQFERIAISELVENQIVRVVTQNNVYYLVVLDPPAEMRVLVKGSGKIFNTPEACLLIGSTFGGSSLVDGCVVKELNLELQPELVHIAREPWQRLVVTTSRVVEFEVIDDLELAEEIKTTAKSSTGSKGTLPS